MQESLVEFLDDKCPQRGASIDWHVLFSLSPLTIVVVGASSQFFNATNCQRDGPQPACLGAGRSMLLGATRTTAGLGPLGIIGLVYAASGMMATARVAPQPSLGWLRRQGL